MKEKNPIIKGIARLIFLLGRLILSLRYQVKLSQLDCIDKNRPVLFLPNHQAVVDPMLLVSSIYPYKNLVPVITSTYYDMPVLHLFFKRWGAVRVSDLSSGSRNVDVLNDIKQAALKAFKHNRSIVIYPSGKIAEQGWERIQNKKSAYEIIKQLPDNVQIIGVRISGLWGSMWSKAYSGKSPDFLRCLLKGLGFTIANLVFFMPRRKVNIVFEDITYTCKGNARAMSRPGFNCYLENFYNINGEEQATFTKYYFWKA